MSEVSLVLLCAGESVRFKQGHSLPKKQWVWLGDAPLWQYVLRTFSPFSFAKVLLVFPPKELFYAAKFLDAENTLFIQGGQTRQDSLRNALECVTTPFVLVSDVARAGVSTGLIARLLEYIKLPSEWDCVVPTLAINDTVAKIEDGALSYLTREHLRLVQTPQLSKTAFLQHALEKGHFTDESSAISAAKGRVVFLEGEESAHKITHLEDFHKIFGGHSSLVPHIRVGSGFDVHSYTAGSGFKVCGVFIPSAYSVVAHSDGDVALHALSDALLGAIGAGDIGEWFPDTDARFKGVSSSLLLADIVSFCYDVGFDIAHIDLTLIAQTPKISPHKQQMQAHLSTLLHLPPSRISLKATTTESLGFIGRKEGIAAQCTALLQTLSLPKNAPEVCKAPLPVSNPL